MVENTVAKDAHKAANEVFKSGDYQAAAEAYTVALKHLPVVNAEPNEESDGDPLAKTTKAHEVTLLSNRAAVLLAKPTKRKTGAGDTGKPTRPEATFGMSDSVVKGAASGDKELTGGIRATAAMFAPGKVSSKQRSIALGSPPGWLRASDA